MTSAEQTIKKLKELRKTHAEDGQFAIIHRETNKLVFTTYKESIIRKVNDEKYKVMLEIDHLIEYNRCLKIIQSFK